MSALSPDVELPLRRGPVEYAAATEADHESIYQTLLHVFQGPDRDAFLGSLSEPTYRPEQRLIVKVDGRVASHVQLNERRMRLGGLSVPVQDVSWVGTLPEYRGRGYAQDLVRLATARARQAGAVLLTADTAMPQFFRSLGWAVCGRYTRGVVASRNLPSGGEGLIEARGAAWVVRPWRQVELGDLMDLYERQIGACDGAIERGESYWRWLIGRRYAHVIWVVCQGETVHGYAFVKDHRVLEIATHPDHPTALQALLGRVRSEALERAYPQVIIHAPPGHPALRVIAEVGGAIVDREEFEGGWTMMHAPDPGRLLGGLLPEFVQRIRQAKLAPPVELGLILGDHRWLLRVAQARTSRVEPDRVGRRHLSLTPAALVRLALGQTDIERAVEREGVVASTSTAIDVARVLFPRRPLWRSPLDFAKE